MQKDETKNFHEQKPTDNIKIDKKGEGNKKLNEINETEEEKIKEGVNDELQENQCIYGMTIEVKEDEMTEKLKHKGEGNNNSEKEENYEQKKKMLYSRKKKKWNVQ